MELTEREGLKEGGVRERLRRGGGKKVGKEGVLSRREWRALLRHRKEKGLSRKAISGNLGCLLHPLDPFYFFLNADETEVHPLSPAHSKDVLPGLANIPSPNLSTKSNNVLYVVPGTFSLCHLPLHHLLR